MPFVKRLKACCAIFLNMLIDEIQKRLRDEIRQSGMSQKEIAFKIGINPSTLSKYMRLDVYPSIETFAMICRVIDVSSDDILGLSR